MPRPAKIWKRAQNGFYYVKINGQQEKLSQDYKEALEIFHQLKNAAPRPKASDRCGLRLNIKVGELCNFFLDDTLERKAPKTYENHKFYLQSFCDFVGSGRPVREVTPLRFDEWLRHTGWSKSTQAVASTSVKACFNWAVNMAKMLLESPLKGVKRLRYTSRERILKPEERAQIKAALQGPFKDLWMFLEMTGCRPFSEAAKVTADMVDWKEGTITFENHKTEHQGKDRVIYLPPPLLARLQELAEKYPTGTLLRTRMGKVWCRSAGGKAMRRLEKKTGIADLNVYVARHTFITDCLAKGMSPTIVGRLVGNSARTIAKFYDHVEQRKDILREAARQAIS